MWAQSCWCISQFLPSVSNIKHVCVYLHKVQYSCIRNSVGFLSTLCIADLIAEAGVQHPVFLRCKIVSSSAIRLWQTRVLLGATAWAEVLQHIPGETQIKISFAKTGILVPLSDSFMAPLNAVRWEMYHKPLSPSWTYLRHGRPVPWRIPHPHLQSALRLQQLLSNPEMGGKA